MNGFTAVQMPVFYLTLFFLSLLPIHFYTFSHTQTCSSSQKSKYYSNDDKKQHVSTLHLTDIGYIRNTSQLFLLCFLF